MYERVQGEREKKRNVVLTSLLVTLEKLIQYLVFLIISKGIGNKGIDNKLTKLTNFNLTCTKKYESDQMFVIFQYL